MIRPQFSLDLETELIVDNFAGGGGASTGIELALGRHVDIAINHDPEAVALHQANHPQTAHHCESVWDIDPRKAANGRRVGLAWFSPDCKHFSKAKGSKPREKKIRGLAWVVINWVVKLGPLRPRVIMLENVEEFQTWCPVDSTGTPSKWRKGWTFACFIGALRRRGYAVEWREMRACDYGAPTIRKRLFLIARCDGAPIVWPEPTHGAPGSEGVKRKKLKPWRTAAECIDWSIPCPSIFERKRELAPATCRRIAKGIMRYVVNCAEPFIVNTANSKTTGRGPNVWPAGEPVRTVTSAPGFAVVAPIITEHANATHNRNFSANEPLRTQCAEVKGGHFAVVAPHITKFRTGSTGSGMDEPLHTVTAGPKEDPAGAPHAMGVVSAFLAKHYGGVVGAPCDGPVHTVTSTDHHGLVTATLVHTAHGEADKTGKRRGSGERDIQQPAHTVTASPDVAVVTSNLVTLRHHNRGQDQREPVQTITAQGIHFAEVRAFLIKYYGSDQDPRLTDPMHTVTARDRFGLVTIKGEDYAIVDIGLRMLAPRELYRAQGFPESYVIGDDGRHGLTLTKSAQVRMCGNSVCPPMAAALVRANVPELAVWSRDEKRRGGLVA
jgi:DNA (cytosine-5)-methyltransferase 1